MIITYSSLFLAQLLSNQTPVLILSLLLFLLSLLRRNHGKLRESRIICLSVLAYISLIVLGLIIGFASGYNIAKVLKNGAPFLALVSFYFFSSLTIGQLLAALRFYLNLLCLLSIFFVVHVLFLRSNTGFFYVFSLLFGEPSSYTGFDSNAYMQIYSPKLFMLYPAPAFMALRPECFFYYKIFEKICMPKYLNRLLSLAGSLVIFLVLVLSTLSDASVLVLSFLVLILAFKSISLVRGRMPLGFLGFFIVSSISIVVLLSFGSDLNFAFPSLDLAEGGNVKRLRLVSETLSATPAIPLGFGASIKSIFAFDPSADYNTELSYLNLYHKFGLLSLFFSPLVVTWFKCMGNSIVSRNYLANDFILFYVSSSLYLLYAIGNPILSLCSFLFVQGFSLACLRSSNMLIRPVLPC